MTPRQAFVSALHLFVVLAFFLAGCFFVSIPHLPHLKEPIFDHSPLIGFALFASSLLLFFAFYSLDRGRYLVLKMGVKTNVQIVRQSVEECLTHQFPQKIFLSDLAIGPKSILQIQVALAPLTEEQREELFEQAEKHLTTLLYERFGYSKPFHLIVKT